MIARGEQAWFGIGAGQQFEPVELQTFDWFFPSSVSVEIDDEITPM
jgi:hypothetical protein